VIVKPTRVKKEEQQQGDLTEAVKNSVFVVLTYSVAALTIFAIGRFSWWLGLVLFAVFTSYILGRLVTLGIIVVYEGLIMRVVFRLFRTRGVDPAKFDQIVERATDVFWTNVLLGSIEVYLLILTILLGASFMW
jgi:hypothetical protein